MFENIGSFFRRMVKPEQKELGSKDAAKERLHLVLMQDRANVSADFLELMKQEILDVVKKYIIIDEKQIDVRLINQPNEDGTNGAPSLYANIPIVNIKNEMLVGKIKGSKNITINDITPTEESETEETEAAEDVERELDAVSDEEDDDVTFDDLLKKAEEETPDEEIHNENYISPSQEDEDSEEPEDQVKRESMNKRKSKKRN